MRLARFLYNGVGGYGIHMEDGMQPVAWEPFDESASESYQKIPHEDLCLLALVVPTKIVCIGLNYRDHAEEFGMDIPEEPTLFLSMEDERRVEVNPREIKESYLEEFNRFLESTRDACRAADCDYERVRTDEPIDEVLLRFLGRRGGKL